VLIIVLKLDLKGMINFCDCKQNIRANCNLFKTVIMVMGVKK
jgi:hypothetical protein